MKKIRVAVIYGGTSSEREVSLKSGGAVAAALDPERFDVLRLDPAEGLLGIIQAAPTLDAALVMLHGKGGEDGAMQGLLDLLGVPYQSAGVLGCALAMHKAKAKECFRAAGLPVAPEVVITAGQEYDIDEIADKLGIPVVIKPSAEGSSYGITIVEDRAALGKAIENALQYDSVVLAEKYLKGREITSGVLGDPVPTALPLVEIIPGDGHRYFDYEAKYTPGVSNEVCPAPLDARTTAHIQEMGVRAHMALGLRHYSRADFILTDEGAFLLETNTIPGMTETSLLPQAAAAAGMSYADLAARLVELALGI